MGTMGKCRMQQAGVSLVELMIAMAISLIVLWALYTLYITQVKAYTVQEQVAEMQQQARAAMDLLSRELHMAGYDPSGVNADADPSNDFPGVTYNATELRIEADLDGNGVTTDTNETITYSFDASDLELQRAIGAGSPQVVAPNIQAFTFSYLDATGNATTVTSQIRQVELTITARTARPDPDYPANNGYRTFTLLARVTPVNLRL